LVEVGLDVVEVGRHRRAAWDVPVDDAVGLDVDEHVLAMVDAPRVAAS
jgi:hypothetical protein